MPLLVGVMSSIPLSVQAQAQAQATARPSITWSFSSTTVDVGAPIDAVVIYRSLTPGTRIVVQRQFGSANQMALVARYGARGSGVLRVALPSDPIGSYEYRVLLTQPNGRPITHTGMQRLYVYSDVSLLSLCRAPGATIGGDGCQGGTVQVGANLFAYAILGNALWNKAPQWGTIIDFPATSCRTFTLNFAFNSQQANPSDVATVQVIQAASAPVVGTAVVGAVTTLTVELDGGPFFVENNALYDDFILYNGTANCWSADGVG
jgi:hypothetical protein